MAGPLRHLGELARAQVGRRASARADGEALRELEARPLALGARLEVEWLGVSGYRFTVEGHSANLVDDAVRERGVDVFIAGVAGRGFTERYWQRILPLLKPRAVVPTRYDNFFRPLGQDLEFVTGAELARLPEEIGEVSGEIELAALARADLA